MVIDARSGASVDEERREMWDDSAHPMAELIGAEEPWWTVARYDDVMLQSRRAMMLAP